MTSRELERRRRPEAFSPQERAGFIVAAREFADARAGRDLAAHARAYSTMVSHPFAEAMVGVGWPVWHHAERVQVDAQTRRGVHEGAGRPKECFEVAAAYVVDHASDAGVRLVHGVTVEHGLPWPHGWCEIGETAYDPTTGLLVRKDSFYRVLEAVALVSYTAAQAASRVGSEGTAGPWWEYARMLERLVDDFLRRQQERCPELAAWVAAMLQRDASFAGIWLQLVGVGQCGLVVVHVLDELERHPEQWRDHEPGTPWPYRLRPLGRLW